MSGKSFAWSRAASSRSPVRAASTRATRSAGASFETTAMTPSAPHAIIGSASESSPERTEKPAGRCRRISHAWSRLPEASFTAHIRGSSASARTVSGSMFRPVRPGTL